MTSWTVDEVCNWLSNLNLGQYCACFRENEIDGTELFNITAEILANDLCIGMFYFLSFFFYDYRAGKARYRAIDEIGVSTAYIQMTCSALRTNCSSTIT